MYTIKTTSFCFQLIYCNAVSNWSVILIKTCEGKSSRLKTKTFGGKIWKKLHSVSPYSFLRKKFKRLPFWSFWWQNSQRQELTENRVKNNCITSQPKKELRYFKVVFFSKPNSLQILFSRNSAIVFVRGDARVPRDMKNMKWQMVQIGDNKMKFRSGF